MLSRKIIFKYAMVATLATAAFITWLFCVHSEVGAYFKVVKLTAGYASLLVLNYKSGQTQSVLIGTGESFDIVRMLGESLPLFHNQIDYLILPSDKEDISGATYVLQRFRVNAIIMQNPVKLSATSTVENLTEEVQLQGIYQIAREKNIPVLFMRNSATLDLGSFSIDLKLARDSKGRKVGDMIAMINNNPKPEVLILGRTTKAESQIMQTLAAHAEDLTLVLFQTLNPDNVDVDAIREIQPANVIVSSFLRPKTKSKAKTKTKEKTRAKSKRADYENVDVERLLTEEGLNIMNLSESAELVIQI